MEKLLQLIEEAKHSTISGPILAGIDEWERVNPILPIGMIGLAGGGHEQVLKIGDGVTTWCELESPEEMIGCIVNLTIHSEVAWWLKHLVRTPRPDIQNPAHEDPVDRINRKIIWDQLTNIDIDKPFE